MRKTITFIAIILIIASLGCNKENPKGKNSLTELNTEPVGENCSSGGFKISSGIDINDNNILDIDEIQYEEYICNGNNGTNGSNSMINVIPEPSGSYCEFGGIKVESGLDENFNGLLDENEITTINYVCNGASGQNSGEISTIRIPFSLAYKWRYPENNWTLDIEDGLIYGFNIADYPGFDSIAFIAQFHRGESTDSIWLRLFDYTASMGITNSELVSVIPDSQLEDPDLRVMKSGNFINSLLSGKRTIGIQFRKESATGRSISIHNAEIILHKSR